MAKGKNTQIEEPKNHTVLIRDLADEEVKLLDEFKAEIGEKTSSKALIQLLHVHKREKQEISNQKKEIDKLNKMLTEAKNKLDQIKSLYNELSALEKQQESIDKRLAKMVGF